LGSGSELAAVGIIVQEGSIQLCIQVYIQIYYSTKDEAEKLVKIACKTRDTTQVISSVLSNCGYWFGKLL
jgi:hypothetical protein